MRRVREGNIIYLVPKQPDTLDLRCNSCSIVKNEFDLDTVKGLYVCECGSSTFTPVNIDLEELM